MTQIDGTHALAVLMFLAACGSEGNGTGGVAGPAASVDAGVSADAGDDTQNWKCLDSVPLAAEGGCNPAYDPTFENIYSNTLMASCAFSSCHSRAGQAGGLVLDGSPKEAHAALTEAPQDEPWIQVIAGDPECSPLLMRLESSDPQFKMPPMEALPDEERCAIIQWIANGAPLKAADSDG